MVGHYSILRISSTASLKEIKSAYRVLALSLHPDVNGGCEKKTIAFKTVSDAYEVLSNEALRQQYDRTIGVKNVVLNKSSSRSRRTKVYAPSAPPPGPNGRIYDFRAWNMAHYGDEGPDSTYWRDRGSEGREHSKKSSYTRRIADKDEIIERLRRRRMERREGRTITPTPLCSIQ